MASQTTTTATPDTVGPLYDKWFRAAKNHQRLLVWGMERLMPTSWLAGLVAALVVGESAPLLLGTFGGFVVAVLTMIASSIYQHKVEEPAFDALLPLAVHYLDRNWLLDAWASIDQQCGGLLFNHNHILKRRGR